MRASLSPTTNRFFRVFLRRAKFLLPLLFLIYLLAPTTTSAQATPSTTINFDQFICLFEKTDLNGKCNPNPSDEDIKVGLSSGILYGKTDSAGITDTGIKTIIMQIGLWADINKERTESKYFYHRVADNTLLTFLIRLSYIDPITGLTKYILIDLPYQKNDIEFTSPGDIRTVSVDTADGEVQSAIAFYRKGPSGSEVIKQQVVLAKASISSGSGLRFGTPMNADFWYCGGLSDADSRVDGRRAPRDGDRVEYFTKDGNYTDINGPHSDGIPYGKTKCDGTAFYKIGRTIPFTLPANKTEAETSSQQTIDSGIVSSEYLGSVLPLCSITPFGDGSVMGCIAQILYGGIFRPVAFFAQLMGKLFDFFVGYSLSDESYRHPFIQTGWQLVRDISNIFFIIIMVWSGLMAVFNTSNVSYKKVVPTLIINALIINFSLFATRVVIDFSNITARIFYNQMVVKIDGEEQNSDNSATGYKPISEAIVSSFNPQQIFKKSVLQSEDVEQGKSNNKENDGATFNGQSDFTASNGKFKRYSKEYASYFALVTLVAIAISFSVAMMFWKTAFIFVGRVIGLYVAMIFSPFAFLSRGNVPLVGKITALNYSSWWKDLTQYALLAPIFIFFLYIINAFLNVEFFNKLALDQNGQTFFGSVMMVLIPMLIIYGLVTQGASIAKSLAGKYGNMAQEFMGKAAGVVVGGALGIATGGTAVAGRNIIGRLGTRLASSQSLQNASSRGGIRGALADRVIRSGSYLSRSNYDARNVRFINNRLREVGATNTRIGGLLGTNQSDTAGGFQGAINREVASQNARADRMLVTGRQAAAQDARNTAWENAYQTARNTAQQAANNAGTPFDETAFRTNYLTTQAGVGNARPQTTAEINRQREQQNNARLARPSMIQRIANRATNRVTTPAGVGGAATSGAGLAAGAATAAITGAATVAAATIVGQGAIQNAAQEQVARQRAGNARNPLSASQITNLQNKLNQLQAELTRRIALMNNIGGTLNPPVTFANLTPANVIDYQADRQRDIDSLQTQIDAEQDYVDRNKNNPTLTNQVNTARSTIRTLSNKQATARNNMRQAGTILSEFNRIQTDIDETRKKLGI